MKKEDKIEVSKIELKISGKTITLEPDQARDLLKALKDLFGDEQRSPTQVHHHNYGYPVYIYPERPYSTPWWWGTVTCGSTSSITSIGAAIGGGATYTLTTT